MGISPITPCVDVLVLVMFSHSPILCNNRAYTECVPFAMQRYSRNVAINTTSLVPFPSTNGLPPGQGVWRATSDSGDPIGPSVPWPPMTEWYTIVDNLVRFDLTAHHACSTACPLLFRCTHTHTHTHTRTHTHAHAQVNKDPHFASPDPRKNLDFQLADDSPAYALGFQRIPMELFGPWR
jgi:hypothetical protein